MLPAYSEKSRKRRHLRRFVFILSGLLGAAALVGGFLVWGQVSGRFPYLSQLISSADVVTPGGNDFPTPTTSATTTSATSYQETFASTKFEDTSATTAVWATDAQTLTLAASGTQGLAQSLSVASLPGKSVSVSLTTTQDAPTGSTILYAISANGGTSWSPILPGHSISLRDNLGDIRWKAVLLRGSASRHPNITRLTLNFSLVQ